MAEFSIHTSELKESYILVFTALQSGDIADFDDNVWDEDFGDEDDDFLDNDDPLEAERWDLS